MSKTKFWLVCALIAAGTGGAAAFFYVVLQSQGAPPWIATLFSVGCGMAGGKIGALWWVERPWNEWGRGG